MLLIVCTAYLNSLYSAMLTYNFYYSMLYIPVQFAMPKCLIAFYAHLVSFSKIRSTLNIYSIKIILQKLVITFEIKQKLSNFVKLKILKNVTD